MQQDTQDIILAELRELRSVVTENNRLTGERVSALETSMYSLIGNGQPGRIALIENAVDLLQQWKWWLIGAAAGVSGAVSLAASGVVWLFKFVKH